MFACLHAPGNAALLAECARNYSPWIEETSPDTVVFDVRGLRLIFGAPEHIAAEIHRQVGLSANIALAANPDAAVHAARGIQGVTVIPPGQEAARLASLPLYLLGGSPEFAATMDAWGIRTFGAFAALPPLGIAARLGDEGLSLRRLARGEGDRLLRLSDPPLEFQEELELDDPVELLEPLLFLLSQVLHMLCARLSAHSLAANEIHLLLNLERAPEHAAILRLPVPMLDAKVFLKLLQLELSGRPPQAAVKKIRMRLLPARTRTVQHGLFLPSSPEPEKLEITLARIRNLVGLENVGAPELADTHRPHSFRMGPLFLRKQQNAPPTQPKQGIRRFRSPQPAQVLCTALGHPAKIVSVKAEGRVIAFAGPWRTAGDWWTSEAWDWEEWDLETAHGLLLRVHRDCHTGKWFLDGSYD
jgi:protein ImuB